MDLKTPLSSLGPVFRMKKSALLRTGLETIEDFLLYVPFRYENYLLTSIESLQLGELLAIQGKVVAVANIFTRGRLSIQKVTVEDATGKIDSVFFNQKFILSTIKKGNFVSFAGKVEKFGSKKTFSVRSYEVLPTDDSPAIHTTGLVPIYSESHGLFAKWIRNRMRYLLENARIDEYLPEDITKQNDLVDFSTAINNIHFPKTHEAAEAARKRLSFDELLIRHTASLIRKKQWEKKEKAQPFELKKYSKLVTKLIKSLPFELTTSQTNAIDEILLDLSKPKPMNRLLEGDVGSGKTVVAAVAGFVAHLNGYQTGFMAPTEILATQHFDTMKTILEPLGVRVSLFTSSQKPKANSQQPDFDIAVGTHSLLQKHVVFNKLGFVVIDEQQRFGVEQRAILREKGKTPHLLSMTATPIPRTIFLTIYSDLSLSVLNQMPKGRKQIKTFVIGESKRNSGYKWMSEKIRTEKSQVFIVCPFIEPSETLATVKAAKDEYERLRKDIFPKARLGLLHGKLKAAEKSDVINKFRKGLIDILVATPVIEVGIDIPTADIMQIEGADRFGLSQLHQLRGRVGRGEKQSYCFLLTDSKSEKTLTRLSYLQTIDNGPELAEIDLKLRGPGDMFGTAQHGIPDLQIASLSDLSTVESASRASEKIFKDIDQYPDLKKKVEEVRLPKISKD